MQKIQESKFQKRVEVKIWNDQMYNEQYFENSKLWILK